MRTIKDFNFKNKRALIRCDYNIPLDVIDDFRIKQTLPTIDYLREQGAKLIIMSHLGRPEGRVVEKLRLNPVQERLKGYLGTSVEKASDCIGSEVEKLAKNMQPGEVLLLENLRFHKEEEGNDLEFAKKLSRLGDIYVNDAFGCSHRAHASIVGVPKFLPSCAGFLLEKEIEMLKNAIDENSSPLAVIIGGVKFETKIRLIEKFLDTAEHILLGGRIAYEILTAKGLCPNGPVADKEVLEFINKIDLTNPKLHLPVDAALSLKNDDNYYREASLGQLRKEEAIWDIGPETIRMFSKIIHESKTVIWNGPLGYFEKENFAKGSVSVANAILRSKAFSIAGGGDTDAFLVEYGFRDDFDHVSTGGGAMLEFLSGDKLPGLEVLNN